MPPKQLDSEKNVEKTLDRSASVKKIIKRASCFFSEQDGENSHFKMGDLQKNFLFKNLIMLLPHPQNTFVNTTGHDRLSTGNGLFCTNFDPLVRVRCKLCLKLRRVRLNKQFG